jgi:hypothetical protein
MIDPTEAGTWFVAAKAGIEALKSAWNLLPRGMEKDELAGKIAEAEQAIERADAKLAKELGYKLCRCTFPPQIMLWNAAENTNICKLCGFKNPRPETHKLRRQPGWTW